MPTVERVFENVESWTAIQGICAWPNLQLAPSGELLAFVFNQPCHGNWEGDLDCWASADQGRTWTLRGRPAAHAPGTNRMNCAAGFASDGDLVVLCSGWSNRGAPDEPIRSFADAAILSPLVCRSRDGGWNWQVEDRFPTPAIGEGGAQRAAYIPFGNIRRTADGMLAATGYCQGGVKDRQCFLFRSGDDGRTWGDAVVLNPIGNETDILPLGGGRWLASSREESTRHIEMLRSGDDGRTWTRSGPLTLPGQLTSHLMRLRTGGVVLTYGNRCPNQTGVDARISNDEGATWSPPVRLADTPCRDCGYPATVEIGDRLVTAYYTQISGAFHYEMRVVEWTADIFEA